MDARHRSLIIAAGWLALGSQTARAQDIEFNGSAFACFFTTTVCTPSTSGPSSVGDAGLSFTSGTFDGTTVDGTAHFLDGIGSFALTNLVHNYTTDAEKILVDYEFVTGCPACTSTGLPNAFDVIFIGTITGNVKSGSKGGVEITWDGPEPFAFSELVDPGQLVDGDAQFSLNTLDINPKATYAPANGKIVLTDEHLVTPEPASIALIATGFVGMVPMVRYGRRRTRSVPA